MKYSKYLLLIYFFFFSCIVNAQELKKTIYIAGLGQSNMVGADDPMNSFNKSIDERVQVWNGNDWVIADLSSPPFSTVSPGANNILFQFGKKYAEEHNVNVRLIYSAKGAKSINYWIEDGVNSVGFLDFTNQLSASNTKKLDIILWHQGEADGNTDIYYQYIQKLLNQFRGLSQVSMTTPIIAGEVANTAAGRVNDKFYGNFQAFIEDKFFNVAKGKELDVIDEGLVTNLHFNAKALTTLGRERYYEAFLEIPRRILKENDIKKDILIVDGSSGGIALRNDSPETIHLDATNNNVVVVLQAPSLCRKRYMFKRLDNSSNIARVITVNNSVDGIKNFSATFKQYDVLELYSDGIEWRIKKPITPKELILSSPNGSEFRITVNDNGVLTTKKI